MGDVCRCVTPEPMQHFTLRVEFESLRAFMVSRHNNQLRGSAYANFQHGPLSGAQLLHYRLAIGS